LKAPDYPEIKALQKLILDYNIKIEVIEKVNLAEKSYYPLVHFKLNDEHLNLYVEDEYGDFKLGNKLLNLCLVIRELENFKEANGFIEWCKWQMFEPNDSEVIHHFQNLSVCYQFFEKSFGEVNSYVSNYDFEMNAGAAQMLRNMRFKE
jgi:hypothetical protein